MTTKLPRLRHTRTGRYGGACSWYARVGGDKLVRLYLRGMGPALNPQTGCHRVSYGFFYGDEPSLVGDDLEIPPDRYVDGRLDADFAVKQFLSTFASDREELEPYVHDDERRIFFASDETTMWLKQRSDSYLPPVPVPNLPAVHFPCLCVAGQEEHQDHSCDDSCWCKKPPARPRSEWLPSFGSVPRRLPRDQASGDAH